MKSSFRSLILCSILLFLFSLRPVQSCADGFPAGTAIATPEGKRPIEEIRAGDRVIAIAKNGSAVAAAVLSIQASREQLAVVRTRHGRLVTTDEHPLRFASGEFLPVTELRQGERLSIWRKGRLKRTSVVTVQYLDDEAEVYSLSVDGPNTFVADGFVVYSKGMNEQ